MYQDLWGAIRQTRRARKGHILLHHSSHYDSNHVNRWMNHDRRGLQLPQHLYIVPPHITSPSISDHFHSYISFVIYIEFQRGRNKEDDDAKPSGSYSRQSSIQLTARRLPPPTPLQGYAFSKQGKHISNYLIRSVNASRQASALSSIKYYEQTPQDISRQLSRQNSHRNVKRQVP